MSSTEGDSLNSPKSSRFDRLFAMGGTEPLLEALGAGYVAFNLDRIGYAMISRGLAAHVGYTVAEMLAWSPEEVAKHIMIEPADLEKTAEHFRGRKLGHAWTDEWSVRHRAGHQVHFSLSLQVLETDVEGRATLMGGIAVDAFRTALGPKDFHRQIPSVPGFADTIALDAHARLLAQTLDAPYVILVSSLAPERHRALVWKSGKLVPDFSMEITSELIAALATTKCISLDENAEGLGLRDPLFERLGIRSLLATQLWDREGSRIGHVLVLDTRSRPDFCDQIELFESLAVRLALDVGLMVASYGRAAAESQLGQVLSALVQGVALLDHAGGFIWSNTATHDILGFNPQAFPCLDSHGRCQWQLLDLDGSPLPNDQSPVVRALATRSGFRREVGRTTSDGRRQWLDVFARPQRFDNSGEVEQLLLSFRDITAEKEARDELRLVHEQLEQRIIDRTRDLHLANRDLETLCYSVSHDLRAPLRSIAAQCRFIEEECDPEQLAQIQQPINRIRRTSGRMSELIDQLLAFTRLTRAEVQDESVDLSELAASFLAGKLELDPGRNVEIEIEPGMVVRGDRHLLALAIDNLLDNAWKYSSKSRDPRIEMKWDPARGAFSIRDNGVGFDSAYSHKLFIPFERLHSDQEFSGIGVGLTITSRIVERHGGKVWLESPPEGGCIAFFTVSSAYDAPEVP